MTLQPGDTLDVSGPFWNEPIAVIRVDDNPDGGDIYILTDGSITVVGYIAIRLDTGKVAAMKILHLYNNLHYDTPDSLRRMYTDALFNASYEALTRMNFGD